MKRIDLSDVNAVKYLSAGETVLLSGVVYTARDAAHKRLFNLLKSGVELPFDVKNAVIYYTGACMEEKDGAYAVTSAGPTTSMRMDSFAPSLYDAGVLATIGKGDRNAAVYDAVKRNGGAYFAAIGGAGALYAAKITGCFLVAYPELGTESVYRLEIEDFPAVVAIDSKGNSVYKK